MDRGTKKVINHWCKYTSADYINAVLTLIWNCLLALMFTSRLVKSAHKLPHNSNFTKLANADSSIPSAHEKMLHFSGKVDAITKDDHVSDVQRYLPSVLWKLKQFVPGVEYRFVLILLTNRKVFNHFHVQPEERKLFQPAL